MKCIKCGNSVNKYPCSNCDFDIYHRHFISILDKNCYGKLEPLLRPRVNSTPKPHGTSNVGSTQNVGGFPQNINDDIPRDRISMQVPSKTDISSNKDASESVANPINQVTITTEVPKETSVSLKQTEVVKSIGNNEIESSKPTIQSEVSPVSEETSSYTTESRYDSVSVICFSDEMVILVVATVFCLIFSDGTLLGNVVNASIKAGIVEVVFLSLVLLMCVPFVFSVLVDNNRSFFTFLTVLLFLIPVLGLGKGVANLVDANKRRSFYKTELSEFSDGLSNGNFTQIIPTDNCMYCVTNDGHIKVFGDYSNTQETYSSWDNMDSISLLCDGSVVGLKKDGTVVGSGATTNGDIDVSHWTNIAELKTSSPEFLIGITDDGDVFFTPQVDNWSESIATVMEWSKCTELETYTNYVFGIVYGNVLCTKPVPLFGPLSFSDFYGTQCCYNISDIEICTDTGAVYTFNDRTGALYWLGYIDKSERPFDEEYFYNEGYCFKTVGGVFSSISAGSDYLLALSSDGDVSLISDYELIPIDGWSDVVRIDAYDGTYFAYKADGSILMGGFNCLESNYEIAGRGTKKANIEIDSKNFPDENFRKYIIEECDINDDGILSAKERARIKMNVSGRDIESLEGIEFFNELMSLDCSLNCLTSLDMSYNDTLLYLDCSSNQISSLSIEYDTQLIYLNCEYNQLTELDLSFDSEIRWLYCSENSIDRLIIYDGSSLLNAYRNGLSSEENDIKYFYFLSEEKVYLIKMDSNTSIICY